ncbi:chitinase, partial [Streptomyces sp. SID11233]|nr:chitinase [Streptomyces sp. SID11233]
MHRRRPRSPGRSLAASLAAALALGGLLALSPTASAADTELLTNGGFESGTSG